MVDDRLLYWALAWPANGARPATEAVTAALLPQLAKSLAQWMAARHARDLTHGLLSSAMVWVTEDGAAEVVGVPALFDPSRLDPSLPFPPRAPEEKLGEATVSGDLWRLGGVIRSLAEGRTVSREVRRLVAQLSADLPDLRPRSADEVVRRLSKEVARVSTGVTPRPTHPDDKWSGPTLTGPAPSAPPEESGQDDPSTRIPDRAAEANASLPTGSNGLRRPAGSNSPVRSLESEAKSDGSDRSSRSTSDEVGPSLAPDSDASAGPDEAAAFAGLNPLPAAQPK